MNTSISGGMEGKDVCIEVFFFFFNVTFFNSMFKLINIFL